MNRMLMLDLFPNITKQEDCVKKKILVIDKKLRKGFSIDFQYKLLHYNSLGSIPLLFCGAKPKDYKVRDYEKERELIMEKLEELYIKGKSE